MMDPALKRTFDERWPCLHIHPPERPGQEVFGPHPVRARKRVAPIHALIVSNKWCFVSTAVCTLYRYPCGRNAPPRRPLPCNCPPPRRDRHLGIGSDAVSGGELSDRRGAIKDGEGEFRILQSLKIRPFQHRRASVIKNSFRRGPAQRGFDGAILFG
jgi:hypothetical protein